MSDVVSSSHLMIDNLANRLCRCGKFRDHCRATLEDALSSAEWTGHDGSVHHVAMNKKNKGLDTVDSGPSCCCSRFSSHSHHAKEAIPWPLLVEKENRGRDIEEAAVAYGFCCCHRRKWICCQPDLEPVAFIVLVVESKVTSLQSFLPHMSAFTLTLMAAAKEVSPRPILLCHAVAHHHYLPEELSV